MKEVTPGDMWSNAGELAAFAQSVKFVAGLNLFRRPCRRSSVDIQHFGIN